MAIQKTIILDDGATFTNAYIVCRPEIVNAAESPTGRAIQGSIDIKTLNPLYTGVDSGVPQFFFRNIWSGRIDQILFETGLILNPAFTLEQNLIFAMERYAINHIPRFAGAVQV